MLYVSIPHEVRATAQKESALTGKSVRQIIVEKLRGGTPEKLISRELTRNLAKLDDIRALKKNWNGNGARKISKKIINRTRSLLIALDRQPQVFPTANDSVQIEYDGNEHAYLEFQVTKKTRLPFYMVDKTGTEKTGDIPFSASAVNELVEQFYG